jgi:hypothetical protein
LKKLYVNKGMGRLISSSPSNRFGKMYRNSLCCTYTVLKGGWLCKLSNELEELEETSCILTNTQWRAYPNIPHHLASLSHTQSHMLLTWTPSLRWLSTSREHSLMFSLTSYSNRLAVTLFCRIFSREGTIGYIGCDSTEHKGQRVKNR